MPLFSAISATSRRNITVRLFITGMVFAVGLSFVLSALQTVMELRSQVRQIDQEVASLGLATQLPAKNAVFSYDENLAAEIVRSLLLNDFISAVTLRDEDGQVLASDASPKRAAFRLGWIRAIAGDALQRRTVVLPLTDIEDEVLNGELILEYNRHIPLQALLESTVLRLWLNLLEITLVAFVLLLIVRNSLTKPVTRLTADIRTIDIENSQGRRVGLLYDHREDELGLLANTINQQLQIVDELLTKNKNALTSSEQTNASLRDVLENLPHLVSVKSLDGIALLANPAFLNTFDLTLKDYLGLKNQDTVLANNVSSSTRQLIQDADEEAVRSRRTVLLPEVEWLLPEGRYLALEMRKLVIQFQDQEAILTVGVDITERKQHQANIQHLAYHDSLTDLPNRHLFIDRLDQALIRAQRSQNFGSLIFVDLDNFKGINDSRGHLAGDTVLVEIAKRLKNTVREEDTVARLGGDEFVICMNDLGNRDRQAHKIAQDKAEALLAALVKPIEFQGEPLQISASFGIAFFNDHSLTASELLKHADMAMYRAKQTGKNKVIIFEEEMALNSQRLIELKRDCQQALSQNQLYLVYQPQVDARINKILGAEALLRWKHPLKGDISPYEFIPFFEESDMMDEVGRRVLLMASRQLKEWQTAGLVSKRFKISINVSPQQFRHPNFTQTVRSIVQAQNLSPSCIDLEITEGMIIDNIDHTVLAMNTLREAGFHFSIDDFGTGYSNLNYLKRLPLDVLKVDQSFVRDIETNTNDAAIVRTILAMADQLKLQTIAEGVETDDQLDLLMHLGCSVYQGYLYSPPLQEVEFATLLQQDTSAT